MKYELIQGSNKGVLIDRTPVLQDVRDTFEVSFLLPGEGGYLALFKDKDSIEYRKAINDGICKVPKELLVKEQFVELTVCQIDNDKVLQSWECEPLKVTAFFGMRRNQWQLSGGMTDNDCLARLAELERAHVETFANVKSLEDEANTQAEAIKALKAQSEAQAGQIKALEDALNETRTAYNSLQMRIEILENN